jgi:hypothetical protein
MSHKVPPPSSWERPVAPGPSWNIPRISLPSCLGPLLQYQQEWWYYAGHAYDTDGIQYSLQFSINRMANAGLPQLIACLTGIGNSQDETYIFDTGYSLGVSSDPQSPLGLTVPPVTDENYEISTFPLLGTAQTRIYLSGGQASGTKGSEYRLTSSATWFEVPYEVDLHLSDERGMVLEWQSGFIGPDADSKFTASSFEFAQPRLRIMSGTLTINGSPRIINRGMLWLDRQVLTYPPEQAPQPVSTSSDIKEIVTKSDISKTLYRGSWMGITLDSGLTMLCACFWQPPTPPLLQWQTGTLLGRPPLAAYGNLYFNEEGRRVHNGGSYMRGVEKDDPDYGVFDFDVNILQPDSPDDSPHWQSQASTQTYSTGWWIRIGAEWQRYGLPENLYLTAVVTGCENVLPSASLPPLNAYWEGAANVYADPGLTQLSRTEKVL